MIVRMKQFKWLRFIKKIMTADQCWASYSNNVIYYSLLVTPFKSNIATLLITLWQQ